MGSVMHTSKSGSGPFKPIMINSSGIRLVRIMIQKANVLYTLYNNKTSSYIKYGFSFLFLGKFITFKNGTLVKDLSQSHQAANATILIALWDIGHTVSNSFWIYRAKHVGNNAASYVLTYLRKDS